MGNSTPATSRVAYTIDYFLGDIAGRGAKDIGQHQDLRSVQVL